MNNDSNHVRKSKSEKRIKGIDMARSIAVFIMIIVNFNLVLAESNSNTILSNALDLLQGKGAALFVVLAGVGISLMIGKRHSLEESTLMKHTKQLLLKRAVFLFVFGLIFTPVWPADILHFYGIYIVIGTFLMNVRSIYLWLSTVLPVIIYPFLIYFLDYEEGWDWKIVEYTDFWTIEGFIRNLFINGFHPVMPWVAFLISGMWFGRQNLTSDRARRTILWFSLTVFVLVQLISIYLVEVSLILTDISVEEAIALFGTSPMPPLPMFMISGISFSFTMIAVCICITRKNKRKEQFGLLVRTGQMAFTHYILHIVVGILSVYSIFGENQLNPGNTFLYAIMFCAFSMCFSHFWAKKFKRGPMSLLLRYIIR